MNKQQVTASYTYTPRDSYQTRKWKEQAAWAQLIAVGLTHRDEVKRRVKSMFTRGEP